MPLFRLQHLRGLLAQPQILRQQQLLRHLKARLSDLLNDFSDFSDSEAAKQGSFLDGISKKVLKAAEVEEQLRKQYHNSQTLLQQMKNEIYDHLRNNFAAIW